MYEQFVSNSENDKIVEQILSIGIVKEMQIVT